MLPLSVVIYGQNLLAILLLCLHAIRAAWCQNNTEGKSAGGLLQHTIRDCWKSRPDIDELVSQCTVVTQFNNANQLWEMPEGSSTVSDWTLDLRVYWHTQSASSHAYNKTSTYKAVQSHIIQHNNVNTTFTATSYQRRHLLLGFILDPAGHPKALEKSSLFTSVPMTLLKVKRLKLDY